MLVSFAIFAISVIAVIISMILNYYQISTYYPDNSRTAMNEFGLVLIIIVFCAAPFLGAELSFIRSGYKMINHEPKGLVKICFIISLGLAIIAVVFQCFVSAGLINFDDYVEYPNFTFIVYFLTEWATFIMSFVLGSLPVK